MAVYINPGVPFKAYKPKGFPIGSSILIQGKPDCYAHRFDITLHFNGGIALQISARFSEDLVVRSSQLNECWDTKETQGPMPFKRDQPFVMKIKADPAKYSIMFNNVEVFTYNYRYREMDRIDILRVWGDLDLSRVDMDGNQA